MITRHHGTGKIDHYSSRSPPAVNWARLVRINLEQPTSRGSIFVGKGTRIVAEGRQNRSPISRTHLPWGAPETNIARCFRRIWTSGSRTSCSLCFMPRRVWRFRPATLWNQRRRQSPDIPHSGCLATANNGRPRRHVRASSRHQSQPRARWTAGSIVSTLNYMPHAKEVDIVLANPPQHRGRKEGPRHSFNKMVRVAISPAMDFSRADLSTVMSAAPG